MKKEIFEGTTIEEAKEKAMKDLNLKEEDLIIKELTKNNTEKKVIEVTKKEDFMNFKNKLYPNDTRFFFQQLIKFRRLIQKRKFRRSDLRRILFR